MKKHLRKRQRKAARLLTRAAKALNACHAAGLDLKVRHGAISCKQGLILPLDDGSFVARTRLYTPFTELQPDDDDDDTLYILLSPRTSLHAG